MNFQDIAAQCQECGKTFYHTVETQRKMVESGQEPAVPGMCDACRQRVQYGGKLHGRVKWFSLDKGYGFIAEDKGSEVFFHRNSVLPDEDGNLPSLEEGQEVLYKTTDSPKGPQAVQVKPFP